jgi:glycosyltransferase involved in cell wall biosynthesis
MDKSFNKTKLRKNKILMVAPRFHPFSGGVEKHVYEIIKRLAEDNQVAVITVNDMDNSLKPKEQIDNFVVLRMRHNVHSKIMNVLVKYYFFLYNIRMFIESDIIHFHDFGTMFYWYLPFRILLFWKKYYITFHGWEGRCPPSRKVVIQRKICEKLTRGNICVGAFIEKWYGTKANIIIYGGIDINILISENGAHPENDHAVYIGRLNTDTGIIQVLEALKILKEKHGKTMLLRVYADGPLKCLVQEYIQKSKLAVELKGSIPEPYLAARYCKVAFVTGYLAILEVMAQKTPVFTVYDNPLKKDYLEMLPGAREQMVIAGSPDDLAGRINEHLNDPGRGRQNAERAFEFAKQAIWENVVDQYLKLWQLEK